MVYCRLCEKLRGDTGATEEVVWQGGAPPLCSRFSFTLAYPPRRLSQSLSLSLLLAVHPLHHQPRQLRRSLTLSSSRRCRSRFKTRSKSRRRGVSLWGFEGRVVSLSLGLLHSTLSLSSTKLSFHISFLLVFLLSLSFSFLPSFSFLHVARARSLERKYPRWQSRGIVTRRVTSGHCFWIFEFFSSPESFGSERGRPRSHSTRKTSLRRPALRQRDLERGRFFAGREKGR